MIAYAAYALLAVVAIGAPLLVAAARRLVCDFIDSFEEDK